MQGVIFGFAQAFTIDEQKCRLDNRVLIRAAKHAEFRLNASSGFLQYLSLSYAVVLPGPDACGASAVRVLNLLVSSADARALPRNHPDITPRVLMNWLSLGDWRWWERAGKCACSLIVPLNGRPARAQSSSTCRPKGHFHASPKGPPDRGIREARRSKTRGRGLENQSSRGRVCDLFRGSAAASGH